MNVMLRLQPVKMGRKTRSRGSMNKVATRMGRDTEAKGCTSLAHRADSCSTGTIPHRGG
jgi:hypothetical protein